MNPIQSVHICGAGGIGTSGIALLFHDAGCHVTATDIRESEITARLQKAGIPFALGNRLDWVLQADAVVTPSQFPVNHAEVLAARDNHIPILSRTEALLLLCKQFDIAPVICIGTTARAKTAAILADMSPDAGFCFGLAIEGKTHAHFAKHIKHLIVDIDERELFSHIDKLNACHGIHLILSDWASNDLGYYDRAFSRTHFEASCMPCVTRYTRVIHDDTGKCFVCDSTNDSHDRMIPLQITYNSNGVSLSLDETEFHIPACTLPDAQAFAVACVALGESPEHVLHPSPVGWFESIDDRRIFDIRMHPVNIHNAIQAMKSLFPRESLTVVIKPFQTTLDAYDFNLWRKAFAGAEQVLVMTPGYNVSDKGCRNLATALKMRGLRAAAHPKKQILAEYQPNGQHQLWIGAPDMFKP